MTELEKEFCDWFNIRELPKELEQFLNERKVSIPNGVISKCEIEFGKEIQQIKVSSFACIEPEEVDYRDWSKSRTEKLETVSKMFLRQVPKSIKFDDEKTEFYFEDCKDFYTHIPVFSRMMTLTDLKNKKLPKFDVTDGNHRTIATKNKGMDCLMAEISEYITLTEEDTIKEDKLKKQISMMGQGEGLDVLKILDAKSKK